MDIKMLDGEVGGGGLGTEALLSIASRQRRRQFFYASLFRCALLTLLFIAFGCFFAIYLQEKGSSFHLFDGGAPFDLRGALKELFLLSLVPSSCFCLCFVFGGRLCRLCGTLFPAVYGIAAGMYFYTELSSLAASFSVTYMINTAPYLCFVLLVLSVYTLFCPVCGSYGECRRRNDADKEDSTACFTYYLTSLTAVAVLLVLRCAASFFFGMFG